MGNSDRQDGSGAHIGCEEIAAMRRAMHLFHAVFIVGAMLCVISVQLLAANDFETAHMAYEKGDDILAELYFKHVVEEYPLNPSVDDAIYYLVEIYDRHDDMVNMLSSVNRFLGAFPSDERCQEVFNSMLKRLVERSAYVLALDYMHRYDYFEIDSTLLMDIAFGLYNCGRVSLASSVLAHCPQLDTVILLRASLTANQDEKKAFYRNVSGVKGKVFLAEYLLEERDTLGAYEVFVEIDDCKFDCDLLYRYAKLCRFFDETVFAAMIDRLRRCPDYKNKVLLLQSLEHGTCPRSLSPNDKEECMLLLKCFQVDTAPRALPTNLPAESISVDTVGIETLGQLRQEYGSIFYFDSLYVEWLIDSAFYGEARSVIEPYVLYSNTARFARAVRAQCSYAAGDYERTAIDIILSHANGAVMRFMLADAFQHLGVKAETLYAKVFEVAKDSSLRIQSIQRLVSLWFADQRYADVASVQRDFLLSDENCVKEYLYALAHTGNIETADSLCLAIFGKSDMELTNHYGEFLIERKQYRTAATLYDSLVDVAGDTVEVPPSALYNWSLIPFIEGEVDTAYLRFRRFIDHYTDGSAKYVSALFKIATIYYLKQEFDSAAVYYGKASVDEGFRMDALENRLICLKKAGNWTGVINVGEELLQLVDREQGFDVMFEIGYAYLRNNQVNKAIGYLKEAVAGVPAPEYLYWLGEAYLGKGDFTRSLYTYRKIIELFPRDEMWTPTAHYKVGIVFEFMDEIEAAKNVYRKIVERRGIQDTWGIEARRRLEVLE